MISIALAAVILAQTAAGNPNHTVQPGDTLSSIAAAQGEDWHQIYAGNQAVIGPGPNVLISGMQLALTSGSAQATPSDGGAPAPAVPVSTASSGGPAAPGSFRACVIQSESGGNYQAVNPGSGAYGAYQFLYSTWVAYGGNPADFGNAPPAEQDQVFQNTYAALGSQPWSPSDGC